MRASLSHFVCATLQMRAPWMMPFICSNIWRGIIYSINLGAINLAPTPFIVLKNDERLAKGKEGDK